MAAEMQRNKRSNLTGIRNLRGLLQGGPNILINFYPVTEWPPMEFYKNQDLISRLNSGRCIVFVGSGPSVEMGYPSWHALASELPSFIEGQGRAIDRATYCHFLQKGLYPELFRQAELDLGSRSALVSYLKEKLRAKPDRRGDVYSFLARWRIACYITTNWDDEIKRHLDKGAQFTVLGNSKNDLRLFRDPVVGKIVKLHGDLDNPDSAIITSADYDKVSASDEWKYWRDTLKFIFSHFDVFIVGHSLADPDLQEVLRSAKERSDPSHPVYMTAADLPLGQIRELHEQFNVKVLQYENPMGDHRQLKHVLSILNRFVIPRSHGGGPVLTFPDEDEVEAATALFLYRKMTHGGQVSAREAISALILKGLWHNTDGGMTVGELLSCPPIARMPKTSELRSAVERTLEDPDCQRGEAFSRTPCGSSTQAFRSACWHSARMGTVS